VNLCRHDVAPKSPHDRLKLECGDAGAVMISRIAGGTAGAFLLTAGLIFGFAPPVRAQAPSDQEKLEAQPAEAGPAGENEVDMTGVDINNLDWSQLNVDASTLSNGLAAKGSAARRAANGSDMTWSGNGKPNGASAVSVKQSVSPFWDARIGADMTVAREPTTMSELVAEKAANGGAVPQSSGTAWAAVTAPGAGAIWDKTAIEARVDPAQEQSKLGTSISKSVPLSEQYSLTLQNGYNMTQQGVVPLPGVAAHPTRNYETEQSAKLNIEDTGTTLTAGQTLSTGDDKWLRKFGAEQKLSDGVSVSGSVGETSQGTTTKSISAGFKRSW
jgi:hypothetical protein